MNIFYKRPLFLSLFLFTSSAVICSIATAGFREVGFVIITAVLAISIIITAILALSKNKHASLFITISLSLAAITASIFVSGNFFDKKLAYAESLGEESDVILEITDVEFSANYVTTYIAKIISIDGKQTSFNAEISFPGALSLEKRDRINADLDFTPFNSKINGYDERLSKISNGVLVSATFDDYSYLGKNENFSILSFFNDLREKISDKIDESSMEETAPIIKALLIGDKSDLDAALKLSFSRLGLNHILAISGTHFTVLLGMLAFLLSMFGINKKVIYIILIPLSLFYMGLTGFSYSVCRAGIMAILSFCGFLSGRIRDSYTALFVAITTILIIAPYAVFSIGLWLSFIATLTIIILADCFGTKILSQKRPWYKSILVYFLSHFAISVAVSFATLPIIAIFFGSISAFSPIANVLIVPLFLVFLYIIPFGVALCSFAFPTATTEMYGTWLLDIIEYFSEKCGLLISVNYNFIIYIAFAGIFLTLLLLALPLKRKILIAVPSILSVVSIIIGLFVVSAYRANNTYISYFTTGISDGVVVTDNNHTLYIDVTNGASSSTYFAKYLIRQSHTTEIDTYVFTHYRSDHAKALMRTLGQIEVKKVLLPVYEAANISYMNDIIEIAENNNIDIEFYDYSTPLIFEGCTIELFNPDIIKRSSHEVISFNIVSKKQSVLYLGSSFSEAYAAYGNYTKDADYIIFGQHYPKAKIRFDFETNATLIYGNKTVYDLSDINSDAYVLNDGAHYNILLK